ncbi:hypothetical protein AB0P17_24560 [Streptomyces sp. NPDC088124]|uniref:hypothetical protein n=1 Tax=Streptomyces sp. NPDC088124 TaxID=3154654 RepID=UPI003437B9D3
MNRALATVLAEAGCSNAALARGVNELSRVHGEGKRYTKASVTRWLQGMSPRDRTPEFVALVLSGYLERTVGAADLGFAVPGARRVAGRALAYREDLSATLGVVSELGAADLSPRGGVRDAVCVAGALLDPQRQWLLWCAERGPDAAAEVEAVAVAELEGVERVEAVVAAYDEVDNRFGGVGVRSAVVRYLTVEVVPLLRACGAGDPSRSRLFTAAAKLTAVAGWSSYDAGLVGLGQRYLVQALRLSAEGGDRVVGGQVLAGLSHLATEAGAPGEGVDLARAGLASSRGCGSALGVMRLHAMEARGYAALGRRREATTALRAAETVLEGAAGGEDGARWVRFLDRHYLQAEAAVCFRDLGVAVEAERMAVGSVLANTERRRRQSISRSVLASVQLAQGRLDEALGTAGEALEQLAGVRSERAVRALEDFRGRLEPHARERAVRDFERRAEALTGGPPAARAGR